MRSLSLVILFAVVLLGGCTAAVRTTSPPSAPVAVSGDSSRYVVLNIAGSEQAMQSPNWTQLVAEWQKAMTETTDAAGIRLSVQGGEPSATGEQGTLVALQVNSFRYVSPAARYLGGVFTGNAYIAATVKFLNLRTGEVLGERSYNTASRGGQGIFAPMTDRQVRAMASEIMAEIKRGP
jgi:hypothetical protein